MSEAKFSKGPWTSSWDSDWKEEPIGELGETTLIRDANGQAVVGTTYYDGLLIACTKENAGLIAAAPELYKAVEGLLHEIRSGHSRTAQGVDAGERAIRQAKVALNKANGVT